MNILNEGLIKEIMLDEIMIKKEECQDVTLYPSHITKWTLLRYLEREPPFVDSVNELDAFCEMQDKLFPIFNELINN